ncbi:hypothetical protein [Nocardia xishanensis]
MNRRRISLAAVALLLGLAVTGCGGSDDDGAQQNTSPGATTSAPSTPSEVAQAQGRPFTPDPTIVGAHPIPFMSWARVADDKIAVNFQTGAPECYGVDAVTTETDKAVTVELRGGTRADAVGRMCVMIAVFGTMEIPLKAPLGDRAVLSAS